MSFVKSNPKKTTLKTSIVYIYVYYANYVNYVLCRNQAYYQYR